MSTATVLLQLAEQLCRNCLLDSKSIQDVIKHKKQGLTTSLYTTLYLHILLEVIIFAYAFRYFGWRNLNSEFCLFCQSVYRFGFINSHASHPPYSSPIFLASNDSILAHWVTQHFTFLENFTVRKVTQNPRKLTWSLVSLPTENSHSSLKANWTSAQIQVSRGKFRNSYQIQTRLVAQKDCLDGTSTGKPRAWTPQNAAKTWGQR